MFVFFFTGMQIEHATATASLFIKTNSSAPVFPVFTLNNPSGSLWPLFSQSSGIVSPWYPKLVSQLSSQWICLTVIRGREWVSNQNEVDFRQLEAANDFPLSSSGSQPSNYSTHQPPFFISPNWVWCLQGSHVFVGFTQKRLKCPQEICNNVFSPLNAFQDEV